MERPAYFRSGDSSCPLRRETYPRLHQLKRQLPAYHHPNHAVKFLNPQLYQRQQTERAHVMHILDRGGKRENKTMRSCKTSLHTHRRLRLRLLLFVDGFPHGETCYV